MEIIIIGGAPGEDLEKYFNRHILADTNHILNIFPEYTLSLDKPLHPQTILETVRDDVLKCIKNNISYYVITFSDHVLNAVRIAYKRAGKDFPITCHQVYEGGKVKVATINLDGRLSCWQQGVWDTWDEALLEIM